MSEFDPLFVVELAAAGEALADAFDARILSCLILRGVCCCAPLDSIDFAAVLEFWKYFLRELFYKNVLVLQKVNKKFVKFIKFINS
jgi:hypothetical protein